MDDYCEFANLDHQNFEVLNVPTAYSTWCEKRVKSHRELQRERIGSAIDSSTECFVPIDEVIGFLESQITKPKKDRLKG